MYYIVQYCLYFTLEYNNVDNYTIEQTLFFFFTQANLFNPKFYPKAHKLLKNQTCNKTAKTITEKKIMHFL